MGRWIFTSFFENREDLNWKIVPKIKDRAGLIKETHLLGHFGVEKTYKDLQNKYYWKGMHQDTQFIISNCMVCIRHQKVPVWDHTAMSLPINDVMDRVKIDYVFGLPLTQDGYKGIAEFIEPLTKFLFLMAIKSKTGEESAR
ncbi:Transposon Ty3-I Gag-Pol poly, partial [Brachionus plicatilis]